MAEMKDIDALIPKPDYINAHGCDERLRVEPLPLDELMLVIRYVEESKDMLNDFGGGDGFTFSGFLSGQAITKMNGLMRLLLPPHAKVMTDEWCGKHLSVAHYRAIIMASIKQNGLHEVFQKAKVFMGAFMESHMAGVLRNQGENR